MYRKRDSKIINPPTIQKISIGFPNSLNGVLAIIIPKLKIKIFLEMHLFLKYKNKVKLNKINAIIQNGIAIFCKNNIGIPIIVIPIKDNKEIITVQIL